MFQRHSGTSRCIASVVSISLAACTPAIAAAGCVGDLDGDGAVSGSDLGALLGNWGQPGIGDLDGSGVVSGADLGILLGAWGPCASVTVPSWATLLEAQPDPAIVTDPSLRSAIQATGLAWRVRDVSTGIELVLVPPGTFSMGCSASMNYPCDTHESPVHAVTLTKPFYMGRHEVTQGQWKKWLGNPSTFQGPVYPDADSRPVESVRWVWMQDFLTKTGFRLPTEAEWEYAYRAGTSTAFHGYAGATSGTNWDTNVPDIGWLDEGTSGSTHPVGQKRCNGFGLFDMSGNVAEWAADRYSALYYASSPSVDPPGPTYGTGEMRVSRGGGYTNTTDYGRASYRYAYEGGARYDSYWRFVGFRVVRDPSNDSVPLPSIASVSPSQGPESGGTLITITGSNLGATTAVTLGGVAATDVQVVNATTVTAKSPRGAAGTAAVSVLNAAGFSTLSGGFAFQQAPWYSVLEQQPDPAVVTNASMRSAISATGLPWRVRDVGTQIEMLLVPPGTFTLGCISGTVQYGCYSGDQPTHQVTITRPFYIGRYEVTQAQWTARMGWNPSKYTGALYPDADNHPVEMVSWNRIQGFLAATGLRLPTSAEWEYACRGGTTTPYHGYAAFPNGLSDDSYVGDIAWYAGNNGASGTSAYGTKAVGLKAPNTLGLYDMGGNVSEVCSDLYAAYSSSAPEVDPQGPATGSTRVRRGGDWSANGFNRLCRSSFRLDTFGTAPYDYLGFRVVRNP